jgi:hypothetical protein
MEAQLRKVIFDTAPTAYIGGLWPVYWITVVQFPMPYAIVTPNTQYVLGKTNLLSAMARLKFAHPDVRFKDA